MSMKKNPKAATAAELEQRFDDGEDITEIADIDPESVIKRRPGGGGGSSRRGGPPQYYIKQTDPKAPDKRADDASWFIGSGWAVEGYDGINFVIDMRDVQITKGRDLDGNEIDVLRGTIWKRKPKQRD